MCWECFSHSHKIVCARVEKNVCFIWHSSDTQYSSILMFQILKYFTEQLHTLMRPLSVHEICAGKASAIHIKWSVYKLKMSLPGQVNTFFKAL